ncbi:MAG: carbohydrate-binding domain-containing protein [Clostridium sp.]|nr:carbohydrate-binding domain-containing protein [Clostridium sp.]
MLNTKHLGGIILNRKLITTLIALALSINLSAGVQTTAKAATTPSHEPIALESVLTPDEAQTTINLNDNNTTITGSGATVDNNKITITSADTYNITGKLTDGQILVNTEDTEQVRILLNGVNISSSTSSAIYILKGDTVLTLADGTDNIISDATNYVYEDETADEPDAAIFSKGDVVINGTGSLTVKGNYNTGIRTKDNLTIESGNINVTSVDDGIKGKDSVTILGGNINITSGAEGIKSTNDKKATKGYVLIEGGTFNINSQNDAIQAESTLTINDGDFTIVSGNGSEYGPEHKDDTPPMPGNGMGGENMTPPPFGGEGMTPPSNSNSTNTDSTTDDSVSTSSKSLKANTAITINGGTFNINSADDSIHSDGEITINNGTFTLETGDDGIHADNTLTINHGNITITKSYEGLEGGHITINQGNIDITSSDDGINAAEDTTTNAATDATTKVAPNMPEQDLSSSTATLTINDGYVVINTTGGDGLDANGSIYVNGGTTIVNGSSADNNGALDYDVEMIVNGGTIVAAGNLGMAETPSDSSTINTLNLQLSSQTAGTLVHVESEDGEEVITFAPNKNYNSVVITSPKLESGKTYTAYTGGTSTGNNVDGIYKDGTYSEGTKVGTATISNAITTLTEDGVTVNTRPAPPEGGFNPGDGSTVPTPPNNNDNNSGSTEAPPAEDDNNTSDENGNDSTEDSSDSNATKTGDNSTMLSYLLTLALSSIYMAAFFGKNIFKKI